MRRYAVKLCIIRD